ncbi:hypothetical protein F220043C3_41420 [Enterocloster asparagiformis]
MGVTALTTMALLIVTGCLEPKEALGLFSNSNVIVMVFMFIVATGLSRTQVTNKLSSLVYKISGGSFTVCFLGYMIVVLLLAQTGMSGIAVFTITYPFIVSMCEKFGYSPSRAIFPFAMVVVTAGSVLPFGRSAITYVQDNGYLEAYGFDLSQYAFGMLDRMKVKLIPVILIAAYSLTVGFRLAPKQPVLSTNGVKAKEKKEKPPLPKFKEACGYIIFFGVLIALMTAQKTGFQPWVIAFVGAVLILVTGVLNKDEAIACLPFKPMTMYIGAFAMGNALVSTGTGDLIGTLMVKALGGTTNQYIICAFFFIVPFLMTQFMSNSSALNILRPLVLMACASMGCSPLGPYLCIAMATSLGFLTPMANVTIPVAMSAGGYDQKAILKMGLPLALGISAFFIFWIPFLFPLWP